MLGNRITVLLFLLFISITSVLFASPDKTSIAVLPLQEQGISPSEALVLTNELRSVIVQSENYIVVERNNMESILKEQGFQQSGCTSAECAVEAGKLLGVSKMVTGSVGKLGELYNINLRMFDVGTGQIEKSVGQRHEGSIEELLDVINKLGYELSGKSTLSQQNQKTSAKDSENDEKMQDASNKSKNRIGLWLGINFPRTSTLSEVGSGYRAGLFYKAHLVGQFFIQPELSYATSTIEYYEPTDILKFEYLNINLLFSYQISSINIDDFSLILEAGPALNSILSAQQEYESYTSDNKSEVNDNSFSIVLGIGLGIRLGNITTTLEARYERGLNTIFKDDIEWEVGKSQAFYIIAGISI